MILTFEQENELEYIISKEIADNTCPHTTNADIRYIEEKLFIEAINSDKDKQ